MESDPSVNNYNIINISDTSSYDDYSNTDPASYYQNISLRYFAAASLEMLNDHAKLKELCLAYGNPEAHYIEGILRYFFHKDKTIGLYHLRQSSIGNNENDTYLYGLLMLALGHYPTGKKYLDKLQWKDEISSSKRCWERIKNSISALGVKMKRRWYVNMVNLEPRIYCHPENNMSLVCDQCYYYKRMQQFYHFLHKEE